MYWAARGEAKDEGFSQLVTRQVCCLLFDLRGGSLRLPKQDKRERKIFYSLQHLAKNEEIFRIKNPVRFKENVPLRSLLPQGLIFDCQLDKRVEETSTKTKYIRLHVSTELAWHQHHVQKKRVYWTSLPLNFTVTASFFYNLAKGPQELFLQWLIYTHVVALITKKQKKKISYIAKKRKKLWGNWQQHAKKKNFQGRIFAFLSQCKLTSHLILNLMSWWFLWGG